jgi:hypothetical protein
MVHTIFENMLKITVRRQHEIVIDKLLMKGHKIIDVCMVPELTNVRRI